jgi:hypothetical protein
MDTQVKAQFSQIFDMLSWRTMCLLEEIKEESGYKHIKSFAEWEIIVNQMNASEFQKVLEITKELVDFAESILKK